MNRESLNKLSLEELTLSVWSLPGVLIAEPHPAH